MYKYLIAILFVCAVVPAYSQEKSNSSTGDLYVELYKKSWHIKHVVRSGETIFMLARMYHVPPAKLADVNSMNYQTGLEKGKVIWVPLGAYNKLNSLPANPSEARVLYYRVLDYDNLFMIARYAEVKQKTLQGWNNMDNNTIKPGQKLKVGWVMYDKTQKPFNDNNVSVKGNMTTSSDHNMGRSNSTRMSKADTIITVKKKEKENKDQKLYMLQTRNEAFVNEEKGTAVFFEMPGKSGNAYFAFHNTAPRGTIIKVKNPGTKMVIYVKVLGALPNTSQYHNSIIGIADNAKKALGITDDKVWCELYYYPAN